MRKLLPKPAFMLAVVFLAEQAVFATPEQDAKEPRQATKPIPEQIAEAIAALRATNIGDYKRWAKAVRDLVQIGMSAVPALIEELDRTTQDRPLRSLGFTLRANGGPKASASLYPRDPTYPHPRWERFWTHDG